MSPDKLLTSAEVAAQFAVDDESVRRWAKAGKLRSIRTPGGRYRFRAEDVQAFLASQGPEAA